MNIIITTSKSLKTRTSLIFDKDQVFFLGLPLCDVKPSLIGFTMDTKFLSSNSWWSSFFVLVRSNMKHFIPIFLYEFNSFVILSKYSKEFTTIIIQCYLTTKRAVKIIFVRLISKEFQVALDAFKFIFSFSIELFYLVIL